jgi:hypothetical protein
MAKAQKQAKPAVRLEMSGVERLGLRVSSMINHPIAQERREVTIHRLDTDGDREWEEVTGLLADTDGIETTFNDGEESVTLRWEPQLDDDRPALADDVFEAEEPAPF